VATSNRYIVTCNGRKVPLRNTGIRGRQVAAVRYKAWEQPSSLHPVLRRIIPWYLMSLMWLTSDHSVAVPIMSPIQVAVTTTAFPLMQLKPRRVVMRDFGKSVRRKDASEFRRMSSILSSR
jgi:hypothetical protein